MDNQTIAMTYDDGMPERPSHDLLAEFEQDLSIIRRDIMAVLQETANVRASMTEVSSWRPAVSQRFVVVTGLACFIVSAAMVVYQSEVRGWVQRIGAQVFMSHSLG